MKKLATQFQEFIRDNDLEDIEIVPSHDPLSSWMDQYLMSVEDGDEMEPWIFENGERKVVPVAMIMAIFEDFLQYLKMNGPK